MVPGLQMSKTSKTLAEHGDRTVGSNIQPLMQATTNLGHRFQIRAWGLGFPGGACVVVDKPCCLSCLFRTSHAPPTRGNQHVRNMQTQLPYTLSSYNPEP